MKIVVDELSREDLKLIANNIFGDMVKAVIDIKREVIVVDAELHSDLEAFLLIEGSEQKDLWGINFYPDADENGFIEFDSMINVRPSQGNRSRSVEDEKTRQRIVEIVKKKVNL